MHFGGHGLILKIKTSEPIGSGSSIDYEVRDCKNNSVDWNCKVNTGR